MASEAVSGRATELLSLGADRNELPVAECPVKLSKLVADKNYCEYSGWYHTDYTLPSEYFLPDIERPADLKGHSLDFTYLFHRSIDNPDFRVMGDGHQIRQWDSNSRPMQALHGLSKAMKGDESEVLFDVQERLVKAMARSLSSRLVGARLAETD